MKNSRIWSHFKRFRLHENMRVQNGHDSEHFKQWLLAIGEGKTYNKFEKENDLFELPSDMISEKNLIDEIYGNKIRIEDESIHEKVILAPRNSDVLELNNKIIEKLEGPLHHSYGIDYMNDNEQNATADYFPIEFMNSFTPNGLPPYDLQLKKGGIVILIRNMNVAEGLCNGTRLKLLNIKPYVLTAKIISGVGKGKIVMLPRIDLQPSEEEVPFTFTRRQFPIRLGYSMTINRAQGQSFDHVGIWLTIPVFSHGQLYVAVSRCRYRNKLRFSLRNEAIYVQQQEYEKTKKKVITYGQKTLCITRY